MQQSAFALLLVLFCSVLGNSAQNTQIPCEGTPPVANSADSRCSFPQNQIAVLKLIGNRVLYVDGSSEYNPSAAVQKSRKPLEENDSLELLPGRHTVRFALFDPNKGKTFQDHLSPGMNVEQVVEVQAGKTYTALWRSQTTGRMAGPLGRSVEREYWVDITELRDDPGAYLDEYEASIKKNDRAAALSALEQHQFRSRAAPGKRLPRSCDKCWSGPVIMSKITKARSGI
jgi:hypothetical protein